MNTHKTGPISYGEVKAAYDEIINAGESATLQNIRVRLGDRGSLETIKKLRAEILRAADEEERRKNPEIPAEEVRLTFLGQAEHLLLTAHSAGLRRGQEVSREFQARLVTLEQERDQLLTDYEDGQRTIREKDGEIARIKQAGENALAGERQRVDDARLEAHTARLESTAYQARTGAKIETFEDALRLAKDELTRTKLHLAKAREKSRSLRRPAPASSAPFPDGMPEGFLPIGINNSLSLEKAAFSDPTPICGVIPMPFRGSGSGIQDNVIRNSGSAPQRMPRIETPGAFQILNKTSVLSIRTVMKMTTE